MAFTICCDKSGVSVCVCVSSGRCCVLVCVLCRFLFDCAYLCLVDDNKTQVIIYRMLAVFFSVCCLLFVDSLNS